MHLDVRDLRSFYTRTRLGRAARHSLGNAVAQFWDPKDLEGQTLVGFGFSTPLMKALAEKTRRSIALMPGQQGVIPWDSGKGNGAVLSEEVAWPIDTGVVDRLINGKRKA